MSARKLRCMLAAIAACVTVVPMAAGGDWPGVATGHNPGGASCRGELVDHDVTCRVCRPEPATKKVTRVVYECKEEWYCLPKCPCPLHLGKHNCCDPCGTVCATCDKPRCRRVLVKKFVTEDKPSTKCAVVTVTTTAPCAR